MANEQQNPMQANAIARQILLSSGVPMKKRLARRGPYALGQTVQIQLDRIGIMTALEVDISAEVTIAAAPAVASPFGLYPILANCKYTDFNSVDRVNSDGVQLFSLNSQRGGWLYDSPISSQAVPQFATIGNVDTTDQYNLPTAIGAAQVARCSLMVPLAYDPKTDLRGAVLAQTVVGDHYLKMTFCNSATGDSFNAPYSGGGVTGIANIYVDVWEWYIQPQNLQSIPQIDLSTIYGVEGNYLSTDNFSAGAPKYINWPNNRSILSTQHLLMNNALPMTNAAAAEFTLVANSNTNLREETSRSMRRASRIRLGGDLPAGIFVFDSRSNPIATTLYGNVQSKIGIASGTVLTTPYSVSQFESFYPAGVPLPGVAAGY